MPEPLLRVTGVAKSFGATAALRDVSFTLDRGRTLGLVGGSGSGKSTLARLIAGFERPDRGQVTLEGRSAYTGADVQLIFQEAAASLNPRFTAEAVLTEPLVIQKRGSPVSRREKAHEWLGQVGLSPAVSGKPAHEFSGGERQRLAIARALILEPRLLILDESFSGLDLLLAAQFADLLLALRARLGLTCILISHDLRLAARISDEIAVMHQGEVVEHRPVAEVLSEPRHPHARELVEATRALSLHPVERASAPPLL